MRDWQVEVVNAVGKTSYLVVEARSAKDAQRQVEQEGQYQIVAVRYLP